MSTSKYDAQWRRVIYDLTKFKKKELKQLIKVAETMLKEADSYWDEVDAEYETGQSAMPPGYEKRRQ